MSEKTPQQSENPPKYQPGEGIRSMKSTTLFRAVNFELYAKPVSLIEIISPFKCLTTMFFCLEYRDNGSGCRLFWRCLGLYHIYAVKI